MALAAVFQAATGQAPTEAQQAEMLAQVRERGLGVEELMDELSATPEGAARIVALSPKALRQQLDEDDESDRATDGPGPARLVFLHIMKTGGTSLTGVLRRWAGPERACVSVPLDDLVLMPRPQLARMRAIAGHIPYEALPLIPGPFASATVLRDPVSRTLSHFRELRRSEEPLRELSLDEFLGSEVYDVPSGNYQARSLAHTIDLAGAWVDYSPRQRYQQAGGDPTQLHPLQALFDSTPIPFGEDELLGRAMRNLSQLDYVGVTEELDAMAARIGVTPGGPDVPIPRLNASDTGEAVDLPASLRRRIERRTEVDRELYETALKRSRG